MPVHIDGIKELRADLRATGANADKALKKVYRRVARMEQTNARSNATAAGGPYAKARTAIKGDQTSRAAYLGVSNSGRIPYAEATFWGARKRTGWYARGQYANSSGEQFPEWVGNHWDVGVPGQGPYVLNYTIAEDTHEIVAEFRTGLDEMFDEAFND